MITTHVAEPFNPDQKQHIDVIRGKPVNESDENLFLLAFPNLFPYGRASCFKRDAKTRRIINPRRVLK